MRRAAVLVALVLAGCGGGGDGGQADAPAPTPTPPQLPGGGRTVFHDPDRRVVAFYGHPDDPALGTLGIGTPREAAQRLREQAAAYATDRRPVLPAMELLATIAEAAEGAEGLHMRRTDDATIRRYLRAARSVDALLLLDIQPGRADFLSEAQRLEKWLRLPDVGLALDPEWHVGPDEVPGDVIGSVDAADIVATGAWLNDLAARNDLPQKLLLVHQFTADMVQGREGLRPFEHVALVMNVDGFGDQPNKVAKYDELSALSGFAFNGFKLFYEEDLGLMSPRQVLRLRPAPDVVVYE